MTGSLVVLQVDPVLAGHLAVAIANHRRWWTGPGRREPDGLAELFDTLQAVAKGGPDRPELESSADLSDVLPVTPALYRYDQAAAVLVCSERQVRRLVADGHIPAVRVGGLARIRPGDLDAYIAGAGRRIPDRSTA